MASPSSSDTDAEDSDRSDDKDQLPGTVQMAAIVNAAQRELQHALAAMSHAFVLAEAGLLPGSYSFDHVT